MNQAPVNPIIHEKHIWYFDMLDPQEPEEGPIVIHLSIVLQILTCCIEYHLECHENNNGGPLSFPNQESIGAPQEYGQHQDHDRVAGPVFSLKLLPERERIILKQVSFVSLDVRIDLDTIFIV